MKRDFQGCALIPNHQTSVYLLHRGACSSYESWLINVCLWVNVIWNVLCAFYQTVYSLSLMWANNFRDAAVGSVDHLWSLNVVHNPLKGILSRHNTTSWHCHSRSSFFQKIFHSKLNIEPKYLLSKMPYWDFGFFILFDVKTSTGTTLEWLCNGRKIPG